MRQTLMQKKILEIKIFLLVFIIFPILSCDEKIYRASVMVEPHSWQLKKIDTIYTRGKYRPSATWYSRYDRLAYIDNSGEFPYPYAIGTYITNFDRR